MIDRSGRPDSERSHSFDNTSVVHSHRCFCRPTLQFLLNKVEEFVCHSVHRGKTGSRHCGKVGYFRIAFLLNFLQLQLMFFGQDFLLFFDVRLKINVVDDLVVRLVLILFRFKSGYFALKLVLQLLFSDLIAGGFNEGMLPRSL